MKYTAASRKNPVCFLRRPRPANIFFKNIPENGAGNRETAASISPPSLPSPPNCCGVTALRRRNPGRSRHEAEENMDRLKNCAPAAVVAAARNVPVPDCNDRLCERFEIGRFDRSDLFRHERAPNIFRYRYDPIHAIYHRPNGIPKAPCRFPVNLHSPPPPRSRPLSSTQPAAHPGFEDSAGFHNKKVLNYFRFHMTGGVENTGSRDIFIS